jgi:hypothetical protein
MQADCVWESLIRNIVGDSPRSEIMKKNQIVGLIVIVIHSPQFIDLGVTQNDSRYQDMEMLKCKLIPESIKYSY